MRLDVNGFEQFGQRDVIEFVVSKTDFHLQPMKTAKRTVQTRVVNHVRNQYLIILLLQGFEKSCGIFYGPSIHAFPIGVFHLVRRVGPEHFVHLVIVAIFVVSVIFNDLGGLEDCPGDRLAHR